MEAVIAGPGLPERWAGDKGDSAGWIRDGRKGHGIGPVIPARKNEARAPTFDQARYRQRNIIERCIGSLQGFRRVATRYEELATHSPAMVNLAIIFRLL